MTILRVNHVTKVINHKMLLDDVSLEINESGIWALVAPTGSGKTTLLRTICHLTPADSGTVELVGQTNKNPDVFKKVAFFQDPSILYENLSGYDHLKYICAIHRIRKTIIHEIVKNVGIEHVIKKKTRYYTNSSKQLLLLAMSLLIKPTLLLMDDPFVGLDSESTEIMWRNLYQLRDKGSTVFITSPNLVSIQKMTNHIIFLKSGKLTEIHSKHYDSTYYRLLVSTPAKAKLIIEENEYVVEEDGAHLMVHLEYKPLQRLMELLLSHNISIHDVQKVQHGTEQLFKEYFG